MKSIHLFFLLILVCLKIIGSNSAFANNKPKLLNVYINPNFEFDSESSGGYRIAGTTNLPDGIKMFAFIRRVESGWTDLVNLSVKDGKLSSEILVGHLTRFNKIVSNNYGFKPSNLSSGKYQIYISIVLPSFQPDRVRKILGNNGELLTGSLAMKSIEFEDVKGIGKTIEYLGSIYLDGNQSNEEDNRVGNEELNKVTTLASEKIYQNKVCNHNYSEAEEFRNLACLNSVVKDVYEETMEMSERCRAEGNKLSGLCYAKYMLDDAEKQCYYKESNGKPRSDRYKKFCLKKLGFEN